MTMSQCLFGLTLHWLIAIFSALWRSSPFTTPVSDFGLTFSCALSAFCKGRAFQTPQTSWLLRTSGLNQVVRNVSNLMTNNVHQAWTALDKQVTIAASWREQWQRCCRADGFKGNPEVMQRSLKVPTTCSCCPVLVCRELQERENEGQFPY